MPNEKKVFIVEDAVDIQLLLSQVLKRAGYIVHSANDGNDALIKLRQEQQLPGLILLDLMMPIMDGFQFREAQMKEPAISGIPVVVMTAFGDVQTKAAAIGANGYLKKPFTDINAILQTVGQFF
jgi:CheY-like chemotaxis protein